MAVAGSWRIYGAVTGLASGTRGVDVSIAVGTGVDSTTTVSLASGFNAITVPTNCTAALFIPPSANAQSLTLKGVTGDTGIALSKTKPTVLALDGSPSLGITAGGAVAGFVIVFM